MVAKYFRCPSSSYETVRASVDGAIGYPNPDTNTATAIPPLEELPRDDQGRVYLVISADFEDIVSCLSASMEEVAKAVADQAIQGGTGI